MVEEENLMGLKEILCEKENRKNADEKGYQRNNHEVIARLDAS
jgi:hypothetical protein